VGNAVVVNFYKGKLPSSYYWLIYLEQYLMEPNPNKWRELSVFLEPHDMACFEGSNIGFLGRVLQIHNFEPYSES
jgi:hypothetical protein